MTTTPAWPGCLAPALKASEIPRDDAGDTHMPLIVHSVRGEFRRRRTPETTAVYARVPDGGAPDRCAGHERVATMTR